jgi:hypothetical protein
MIKDICSAFEKGSSQYIWLKSLKDRVQSKQEWSEEDEEILASIEQLMSDTESENGWNCVYLSDNDKEVHYSTIRNWLKSLRPQNTWKPSEEQMKALLSKLPVLKGSGDKVQDILESLYNDLRKLREE